MCVKYFKNKNYKGINLRCPYKSDLFTGVQNNDLVPFKVNNEIKGYYQQCHSQDFILQEILRQPGFHDTQAQTIYETEFLSVKP